MKKLQVGVLISTFSSVEIKFTLCSLKNSISSNKIKVFLAILSKRHTTSTSTLPDWISSFNFFNQGLSSSSLLQEIQRSL